MESTDLEYLSSGENLAGCADFVILLSSIFFSVYCRCPDGVRVYMRCIFSLSILYQFFFLSRSCMFPFVSTYVDCRRGQIPSGDLLRKKKKRRESGKYFYESENLTGHVNDYLPICSTITILGYCYCKQTRMYRSLTIVFTILSLWMTFTSAHFQFFDQMFNQQQQQQQQQVQNAGSDSAWYRHHYEARTSFPRSYCFWKKRN